MNVRTSQRPSDRLFVFIRHLRIQKLKLLRDFELSFVDADGKPRMWTVLIGENGTGKTSILQAIAMAAAGRLQVNTLAELVTPHLRDRRQRDSATIEARFGFLKAPKGAVRQYPLADSDPAEVLSQVWLQRGATTLEAASCYVRAGEAPPPPLTVWKNPLDEVRSKNLPLWFVAGYGVARVLPDAGVQPRLDRPAIDRLKPLFGSGVALTSTAFANYFGRKKAQMYSRVVKTVLLRANDLLPAIDDVELRGAGGVTKAGHLRESKRFTQQIGSQKLKLPATALSHGYQSTIAWIADLAGHIVLESENEIKPQDMQGLVLIDELGLYLHPTWQVVLVSALRETFPRLQFVATTHSPLVLAGMHPTEIVRLKFADSGDVERASIGPDARVMTGTEIYREYFGIDDVIPDKTGRKLRTYRYLAANPYRSDEEDVEIEQLRNELRTAGVDPAFAPVPRKQGAA
jgi:hypothetical protein